MVYGIERNAGEKREFTMETVKHINAAFRDGRGEIFNVFEGKIGHVALITSKKGSVRANHYHNRDHQYMYLISGAYESHSCDIENPAKKQILRVKPGDIVSKIGRAHV